MKVLFVCHGNRFRSPFAAGYVQTIAPELSVFSAGVRSPIGNFGAAKPARDAALIAGFSLDSHRASGVFAELINTMDLVLYMDSGNLRRLKAVVEYAPYECLGAYANATRIPDPSFCREKQPIWDLICKACRGLVARL